MKATFLRSQVLSWMAGVIFVFLGISAIIEPRMILEEFSSVAWLVIPILVLSVLFIWRLAVLLRRYDLLAILPCLLLAAVAFGGSYSINVSNYLPDDGHTFFNILGGTPPFAFWGQAKILGFQLLWAGSIGWAGIGLKRFFNPMDDRESPPLSLPERRRFYVFLLVQSSLVVLVTAGLLFADVVNRMHQETPMTHYR